MSKIIKLLSKAKGFKLQGYALGADDDSLMLKNENPMSSLEAHEDYLINLLNRTSVGLMILVVIVALIAFYMSFNTLKVMNLNSSLYSGLVNQMKYEQERLNSLETSIRKLHSDTINSYNAINTKLNRIQEVLESSRLKMSSIESNQNNLLYKYEYMQVSDRLLSEKYAMMNNKLKNLEELLNIESR